MIAILRLVNKGSALNYTNRQQSNSRGGRQQHGGRGAFNGQCYGCNQWGHIEMHCPRGRGGRGRGRGGRGDRGGRGRDVTWGDRYPGYGGRRCLYEPPEDSVQL